MSSTQNHFYSKILLSSRGSTDVFEAKPVTKPLKQLEILNCGFAILCQMTNQYKGILHTRIFESNIVNLFFSCADLKTMSERLKNRYYVSKKLFMADLQRVFTNCREYNPPESEYYKCANILEKFFYTKIKEAGLIDK